MISDKDLIESVIKEQKEKGVDELKIYKEAYEFAITQLDCNRSIEIQKFNKQIADGIHELSLKDQWSNLQNVAKHAMVSCLSTIDNNESLKSFGIRDIISFQSMILNMGRSEFLPLLTKEAKQKYFPNKDNQNGGKILYL